MSRLGESIAILDGFDLSSIETGDGVTMRRNVIDPSDGANYGGGSSFAPGLPLMPSTVGLAGCAGCGSADSDLSGVFAALDPNVTQRRNVIDPSGGANYGGGSSFAPGLPLMPSTVGLADMDPVMLAYMNAGPGPNVVSQRNVVDPSHGANYTGGSSFAPGMPLMVSSAGLAELNVADPLDNTNDRFKALAPDAVPLFKRVAGKQKLVELRQHMRLARARGHASDLARYTRQFAIVRKIRRTVASAGRPISAQTLDALVKNIAGSVAASPNVPVNTPPTALVSPTVSPTYAMGDRTGQSMLPAFMR